MSAKTSKSIFLADDDADDCMLFENALREVSDSAELITASDGVELISLLEAAVPPPPDIIFLDLNMPRKNGFECLEQIRNTKAWERIPVIIFSTSCQEEMVRKVHQYGASLFIRKPGSYPKLKQAIKQVLDIDWNKHNWKLVPENFSFQY